MAHFAEIGPDNVVVRVIVISDDDSPDPAPDNEAQGQAFIRDVLGLDGNWLQTSYNNNFRGNFASPGDTYDQSHDAFIPPKEFPSWTLDETTFQWTAPVAHPNDGNVYYWDESSESWMPR